MPSGVGTPRRRCVKFKVETRDKQAYVTDESGTIIIEVTKPADFQHAWRVAEFFAENVQKIDRVADR
jgi:hypothetical protein